MVNGMQSWEQAVAPLKQRLFTSLFAPAGGLPSEGAVIVELGMGTLPNARWYADALRGAPRIRGLDLIGVDPNEAMLPYARKAFDANGLGDAGGSSLRGVKGVAEAIPLDDGAADAVVCTLTLCSVVDPVAAVREVLRVLKPGGHFLFVEHVLSESDAVLAAQQRALSPLQVLSADGCHLDRRTVRARACCVRALRHRGRSPQTILMVALIRAWHAVSPRSAFPL